MTWGDTWTDRWGGVTDNGLLWDQPGAIWDEPGARWDAPATPVTPTPFWPTIQVEVAWSDGAYSDPTSWSSILDDVLAFTTQRGRTSELGTFPTGTCAFTLDDSEAQYDVDNAAGPHYGKLSYNRQIRILATWDGTTYPVWRGYVDDWGPDKSDESLDFRQLTVNAQDAFKLLSIPIEAITPFILGDATYGVLGVAHLAGSPTFTEGQTTGDRIAQILSLIGWPSTLQRIDSGHTLCISDTPTDNVLQYSERIEKSELGLFFAAEDGAIELHARRSIDTTIQCTLSDVGTDIEAGTALPFIDLTYDQGGRSTLKNVVTRSNGRVTIQRRDATSVQQYVLAEDSETDILTLNPDEIDDQCRYLVGRYSQPLPRVTAVTLAPEQNPAGIWPQILGRKIGERIAVTRTPKTGGTPVTQHYTIEAISHSGDAAPIAWRTTWQLAAAHDETGLFTLGTSTLGGADLLAY